MNPSKSLRTAERINEKYKTATPDPLIGGVAVENNKLIIIFGNQEDAKRFCELQDLPPEIKPYEPDKPIHVFDAWLVAIPITSDPMWFFSCGVEIKL